MKHRPASMGMPACLKRQLMPEWHSPFAQNLQGGAHVEVVLDSRAASGGAASPPLEPSGADVGGRWLAAAAFAAAARFLSDSFIWA